MKNIYFIFGFMLLLTPVIGQVSFQKDLPNVGEDDFAFNAFELSDHTFYIESFSQYPITSLPPYPCDYENTGMLFHTSSNGTVLKFLSNTLWKVLGNDKYFQTWYDTLDHIHISAYNSNGDTIYNTLLNDSFSYSLQCVTKTGYLFAIAQNYYPVPGQFKRTLNVWNSNGTIVNQISLVSDTPQINNFNLIASGDGGIIMVKKTYNTSSHAIDGIIDSLKFLKLDSLGNFLFQKEGDTEYDNIGKKDNGIYLYKEDVSHFKSLITLNENLDTIIIQQFNDIIHWDKFIPLKGNNWAYTFINSSNNIEIGIVDSLGSTIWHELIKYPVPNTGLSTVGFIYELSNKSLLYGGYHNQRPNSNPCIGNYSTAFISSTDSTFSLINVNEINREAGMYFYPNPVITTARIDFVDNNFSTIEIFDLSGNLIKRQLLAGKNNEINREDITSGIYFYRVIKENTILYRGKIIFQ
jgi:hypothetical protein